MAYYEVSMLTQIIQCVKPLVRDFLRTVVLRVHCARLLFGLCVWDL